MTLPLPADFTGNPIRAPYPRQLMLYDEVKNRWNPCTESKILIKTSYLAITYRQSDFTNGKKLKKTVREACHTLRLSAYWLDIECTGKTQDEKNRDLYRIADVFSYAKKTLILIRGDNEDPLSDGWLSWGGRVWTLPEALLSQDLLYKVGTRPIINTNIRQVANCAYKDIQSDEEAVLVDHYGTGGRSTLDLTFRASVLASAIWRRSSSSNDNVSSSFRNRDGMFTSYAAERVYAMMGFFPRRIMPDERESEETAFERLMDKNGISKYKLPWLDGGRLPNAQTRRTNVAATFKSSDDPSLYRGRHNLNTFTGNSSSSRAERDVDHQYDEMSRSRSQGLSNILATADDIAISRDVPGGNVLRRTASSDTIRPNGITGAERTEVSNYSQDGTPGSSAATQRLFRVTQPYVASNRASNSLTYENNNGKSPEIIDALDSNPEEWSGRQNQAILHGKPLYLSMSINVGNSSGFFQERYDNNGSLLPNLVLTNRGNERGEVPSPVSMPPNRHGSISHLHGRTVVPPQRNVQHRAQSLSKTVTEAPSASAYKVASRRSMNTEPRLTSTPMYPRVQNPSTALPNHSYPNSIGRQETNLHTHTQTGSFAEIESPQSNTEATTVPIGSRTTFTRSQNVSGAPYSFKNSKHTTSIPVESERPASSTHVHAGPPVPSQQSQQYSTGGSSMSKNFDNDNIIYNSEFSEEYKSVVRGDVLYIRKNVLAI